MTKKPLPVDWLAKDLPTDQLLLDPENPRLKDAGLGPTPSQEEILVTLWKRMAVDEVAMSIAENGFFRHEPLFAEKAGRSLHVIEGNRRLAAVKLLLDDKLRDAAGAKSLPKLSAAARTALQTLPVIVCERGEVWTFLGFKHINGPQAWESYAKAHYVAWVHNKLGVPLEEIATRIGDKHSTVQKFYESLMVLDQAEEAGVYDREDRYKAHFSFSHLTTGLGYSGIRKYVGLALGEREIKERPVPKTRLPELGELLGWLYGSKKEDRKALVISQNPDLRELDQVLGSKNGTVALRKGLPLKVSLEISKGDERVFREALIATKQNLQKARGTVLTGFSGSTDLLQMAKDIVTLADTLLEDMQAPGARSKRSAKNPA